MTIQPLMGSGLLVRGYRDALLALGLMEGLCAQLPPATAQLLRHPPSFGAWLPGAWVMETAGLLFAQEGRAVCRQLGSLLTRDAAHGVLQPLVTTILALHRTRMEAIYGRLGMFTQLLLRGPELIFTPLGERSGTLEIAHLDPVPEGVYAVWEGSLLGVHQLCGVKGGVGETRLCPGGRSGTVDIQW
jgi:hypothetical protein